MPEVVMAIDPGRAKCGVAIASAAPAGDGIAVLYRGVIETAGLIREASELMSRFHPDALIIGNGTASSDAARALGGLGAPVTLVEEQGTTLLARKRFFRENPPRRLRRLIPTSFQTPGVPYDDYVAEILAERYLKGRVIGS